MLKGMPFSRMVRARNIRTAVGMSMPSFSKILPAAERVFSSTLTCSNVLCMAYLRIYKIYKCILYECK